MRLFKKAILAMSTLVLALAAFVAPANNTKVEAADGIKLYLTPNSNWKTDNPRYAIYTWDHSTQWYNMADTDGDGVFEGEVPAGTKNVIFCRMNPNASANNWNNKWNQTSDLKYDGANNHYIVKENTWDKGGGTWTVFGSGEVITPEPEPEPGIGELDLGVIGSFCNWGEDVDMTYNTEKERYEVEIEFSVNDEWKIRRDNDWGFSWGWHNENVDASTKLYCKEASKDGNILVTVAGKYLVWIDSTTTHIGMEKIGETVEPDPTPDPEPEVGNLVLGVIGSFASSNWATDIAMTYNAELERYEVTMEFAAGDQFKIRKDQAWTTSYGWHDENNHSSIKEYCVEGTETNGSKNGNISVKAAGQYLVWIDNNMSIGMEPVVEPWELEVAVGFQVGTKDEAKALRLVAEFNLDAEKLESFDSEIQFRVTKGTKADTREVTRLYSSVNPMNDEAELTGAYYAVLTYVNIPAGEYLVEVLVDGEVAATVVATVA